MLSAVSAKLGSVQAGMSPEQAAALQGQVDTAQEQLAMMGQVSFVIKLNKATICAMGACQTIEIDMVSRFGATFVLGFVVFLGMIWITFNRVQGNYSPPFQGGICITAFLLLFFVWISSSGPTELNMIAGLERGWGPIATAAGAVWGVVAVILLGRPADATSAMGPTTYVPTMANARPMPTSYSSSGVAQGSGNTVPPLGSAGNSGAFAAARGAASNSLPAPMLDLSLPPAAEPAGEPFVLRAEATIARISPKGIQAKVVPNDTIVAIAWGELQEMRMWALPENVEGGRVFAEFIGSLGVTVRLTINSQIQFRDLQSPEGGFDTLIAFIARVILSQKPGFTIDDQTLYFLRGEAPPPRFSSLAALREHDKNLT